MADLYVGVRADWHQAKIVLARVPWCLNERSSRVLRRAGRMLGVKGQEKGKLLQYYKMTECEYQSYIEFGMAEFLQLQHEVDWRPAVTISECDFDSVYTKVNSRYPDRMEPDTYQQYQLELVEALAPHLRITNRSTL